MQNPHPLFVHFPIAFLVAFGVAALLGLFVRRPGLDAFTRACLFLGTFAAAGTVISGFLAEQGVARVAAAREVIGEHRTFAYELLILAVLLSAAAAVAPRFPARAGMWRVVQAIGAAVLLYLGVATAKEGGELVHELGVGTKMTAPGGPLHEGGGDGATAVPADSTAPNPTGRDFR